MTYLKEWKKYLDSKLELFKKFRDEQRVRELFASFHDTDNSCIHLELSVLEDTLGCRTVFFRCFLELNRIDFYPGQGCRKIFVELECVSVRHVLGLWVLYQNPVLATGQRLQRTTKLLGLCQIKS